MRKLFDIFLCLSLLLTTGCVQELTPGTEQVIELTVASDGLVLTKADPTMDESYHESRISWVDFFFYPGETPDPTTDAVYHIRKELETPSNNGTATFQLYVTTGVINSIFPNTTTKATVFLVANYPGTLVDNEDDLSQTSSSELEALRVSSDFAAPVNHKQDRFMMWGRDVLELKAKNSPHVINAKTVNLTRYASKMTVSVYAKETVQLDNDTAGKKEQWHPMIEGMEVYLMDVVGTVKLGGRDNAPGYFDYSNNRKRFAERNNQTDEVIYYWEPTITDGKTYYNTFPMYMYPQQWVYNSSESPTREPYLKLILPWYRDADNSNPENPIAATQKQCYYKVMMPEGFYRQFNSNNWYHLDIDVEILGALTDVNAVSIPGSYTMVPWQNKQVEVKQASVGSARYLSIDQDTIRLYNINELTIPYNSSHAVRITHISAGRPYFGEANVGTWIGGNNNGTRGKVCSESIEGVDSLYLDCTEAAQGWFTNISESSNIRFNHALDNDYKNHSNFDYSPYTIRFTLEQTDRPDLNRTVVIIQSPAIFIDKITNSDAGVAVNTNGTPIANGKRYGHGTTGIFNESNMKTPSSTYWGYTFVDGAYKLENGQFVFYPGYQQMRTDINRPDHNDPFFQLDKSEDLIDYQWRTVWYTGGSPDLFQISVSALGEDSEFVIGDPREYEYDRLLSYHYTRPDGSKLPENRTGFSVADAIYPGNEQRTLEYYLKTDESDRTKNMLAPSYRFSSKFSGVEFGGQTVSGIKVNNISREYARYRCAAYQEDGFPAGRWRLPTEAEIHFVAQLSANGAFAPLFSDNQIYWSAQGAIKVNGSSVTVINKQDYALLRCVYDTWYWGEDQSEFDEWSREKYPNDWGTEKQRYHFVWGDKPRQ